MNKEFEWNDKSVKEMLINLFGNNERTDSVADEVINKYKASKQPVKDWEIQCIQKEGKNYWVQSDGLYKSDLFGSHLNYQWLLANGGKIHSVRRKSDGEVFSIGQDTEQGKIVSFEIYSGSMYIHFTDGVIGARMWLNDIRKVKQPLFQSFDGKMMYENDKCWILSTGNWCISETVACGNPFTGQNGHFKYFSTEAAAKEFVLLNKPILSVNDVHLWFCKDTNPIGISEFYKGITELAKQKLNQ